MGEEDRKKAYKALEVALDKVERMEDMKPLREMLSRLQAKGIGSGTAKDSLDTLARFSRAGNTPLNARTPQNAIEWLNSLGIMPRTANLWRHHLSYFYGPEWAKAVPRRNDIKPTYNQDDILTKEQRYAIVKAANNDRDRALLAVLADSSARKEELLDIRFGDVKITDKGDVSVFLNTAKMRGGDKEARREAPLFEAAPFLKTYLNSFPAKTSPDTKLFPIGYIRMRDIIIIAAEKAGIKNKAINPHAWRHSRLTEIPRFIKGEELCRFAGWKRGSNMAGVYDHVSSSQVAENLRATMGRGEMVLPKPAVENCPRCRNIVPPGIRFCPTCGAPQGEDYLKARVEDWLRGETIDMLKATKKMVEESIKNEIYSSRLLLDKMENAIVVGSKQYSKPELLGMREKLLTAIKQMEEHLENLKKGAAVSEV